MRNISYYIILIFIAIVLVFSIVKKNNAYESFINGCESGMKSGITILPYLLVMYVAVAAFRSCGILEDLLSFSKVPSQILIQGVFRPVSSHASLSMMVSIINTYGVDSSEGIISTILQGGSDTTVYVMGLYFGYIGIKKTRHAYFVGLLCDLVCFVLCMLLFLIF